MRRNCVVKEAKYLKLGEDLTGKISSGEIEVDGITFRAAIYKRTQNSFVAAADFPKGADPVKALKTICNFALKFCTGSPLIFYEGDEVDVNQMYAAEEMVYVLKVATIHGMLGCLVLRHLDAGRQ